MNTKRDNRHWRTPEFGGLLTYVSFKLGFKRFMAIAVPLIAAATIGCGEDEETSSADKDTRTAEECKHCFTDDFSGKRNGWPEVRDDEREAGRVGEAYRYTLKQPSPGKVFGPDQFGANRKRLHYADSTVSVTARTVAGEPVMALVCRWDEEARSLYAFGAYQGKYTLMAFEGDRIVGQGEVRSTPPRRLTTGPLPQGTDLTRPTKLEASCKGDRLTFSVGGERVASVRDPELKSGSDGLLIATAKDPELPATAVFDDYGVR